MMRVKQRLLDSFPALQRLRCFIYRLKPYKVKFNAYYKTAGWNCPESKSGPGSTLDATARLREALPALFVKYNITSILDAPCGDFNWMRHVPLEGIDYTGGDIVEALVADNQRQYGRDQIRFIYLDLMKTTIPAADLMICRDCLFHYPNEFVLRGLRQIAASGCKFLLTSTFPTVSVNTALYSTGWFRPVNLEAAPFLLPPPDALIVEEEDRQKCMGLWPMEGVRQAILRAG